MIVTREEILKRLMRFRANKFLLSNQTTPQFFTLISLAWVFFLGLCRWVLLQNNPPTKKYPLFKLPDPPFSGGAACLLRCARG